MEKEEIKRCLKLITWDQIVFNSVSWHVILNPRGTCCAPPPEINEALKEELKTIFQEDRDLYEKCNERLRCYFERHRVTYTYTLKAYIYFLDGFEHYDTIYTMILNSLAYRGQRIELAIWALPLLKEGTKE